MKKLIRITALILSVLLLCAVFTGCDELDRMKKAHAVKNENGNILLNGNEYKQVSFASRTSLFNFDLVPCSEIYVTEPDVPVLLSEGFYEYFGDVSEDGKYLYIYNVDYNSVPYCRTDEYDNLIERLEAPFEPEVLAYPYSYYDYDNDEEINGSYVLTEDEQKAVEQVMLSVEPVQLEGYGYSEYDADDYIYIYECSEDLIFNRIAMILEVKNGRYAVATDIGGGITEVRRVPDELFKVFQNIMAQNYYYTSDYEALVEEEI